MKRVKSYNRFLESKYESEEPEGEGSPVCVVCNKSFERPRNTGTEFGDYKSGEFICPKCAEGGAEGEEGEEETP
jgi:hypothetical protein